MKRFALSFLLMILWISGSFHVTAAGNASAKVENQTLRDAVSLSASRVRWELNLRDWQFVRGDNVSEAAAWEKVRIPHDWAIKGPFDKDIDKQVIAIEQNGEKIAREKTGRTGALPYIGVGWYRCEIPADEAFRGKRLLLVFDGAMSQAQVYVNDKEVGQWPYGYNSFYFDITAQVNATDEAIRLAVRLENVGESSRWYPGAGLYRHVRLLVTEPTAIELWGANLSTPKINEKEAWVHLETEIHCPVEDLRLQTKILDALGREVASHSAKQLIQNSLFVQDITVPQPNLWSPENPYLYRAVSYLYQHNQLIDTLCTRFGIRSVKVDAENGFQLNGKTRKIKGVCLHHDLGPLGAAVNRSAMERQLRILKDMGCDAIRSSHNMPSPEQVELCDELGLMMMAESFDEWAQPKCKNGYNRFYEEWVDKDIENLVCRYRNHPSIVMWSAGNEVSDQWSEKGVKEGWRLQEIFHRLDPTRPVTMGMDQVGRTIKNGFAAYWDVPGLNYRLPLYQEAHQRLPQGFLLGSETASTVSSRGVYHFPVVEHKSYAHQDGQCSSYDVEACSWSNLPDDDWPWQDDHDWVIGEFVWTGFDYLGEPTPYDHYWPSRSSYFGICDLAGLPKDRYYLYRSRWNTEENTLHVLPHWTWPGKEGDTIPVYVYTNYPQAELFVNGVSQGIRKKDTSSRMDRYRLRWNEVLYQPGEILVVAYNSEGVEMESKMVKTAGKPAAIRMESNRMSMPAYPDELTFITISIVDKLGNLCPDADNLLRFSVKGAGVFKAVCNGDATSTELFHLPQMHAFNGQLVVIVQSNGEKGNIRLKASAAGLPSSYIDIISE